MKHIKKISCETCIRFHCCSALYPSMECWMGKKNTSMEDKIREREEISKFRKSVAKYM
jgi:hypothetical protein